MPLRRGQVISAYQGQWTPRPNPRYRGAPGAPAPPPAGPPRAAPAPHLRDQVIRYPRSGLSDLYIILTAIRGAYAGEPYLSAAAAAVGATGGASYLPGTGVGVLPKVAAYVDQDAVLYCVEGTTQPAQWLSYVTASDTVHLDQVPGRCFAAFGQLAARDSDGGVYAAVRAHLAGLPDGTQYALCGHSLGGVVAEIAARVLDARWGATPTCVVTFGSPRPGDPEFAAGNPSVMTRVVVSHDPVPQTPPPALYSLRQLVGPWTVRPPTIYAHTPATRVVLDPDQGVTFDGGASGPAGDAVAAARAAIGLTDRSELHGSWYYAQLLRPSTRDLAAAPWSPAVYAAAGAILAATGW